MADTEDCLPHPRANPALHGHASAETELMDCYLSGRLPHAWLITGPKGVGKATLAYRFARFLLAQGVARGQPGLFSAAPDSLHVDPGDPVFHRVASGGETNLLTIERMESERTGTLSSVLRVDQVRKLGKFFALTAADGGWRIAIIDGADEMNVNAANAVLKILEEPPAKAILLLTSTASSRVLPTIRSRCRKLGLRPLGPEALGCAVESQRPDISGGDLAALRHLSEGSPGRALSLAGAGGVEVYRELIGLLESLPTLDPNAWLKQRSVQSSGASASCGAPSARTQSFTSSDSVSAPRAFNASIVAHLKSASATTRAIKKICAVARS